MDDLNEYLGALWCSAGLQLALLFSQMSYQACDSCDQLLEVGEPGSEVGSPGFWPSPSRKMSVFLLLTPLLQRFLSLPQMFYPPCTYSLEIGSHCTDTQTFYNISFFVTRERTFHL